MNELFMLQQLAQAIPMPPDSFYYTMFVLVATALIWIIRTYIDRTDKTLKQLVDTVARLDKMIGIHEEKHDNHEKEFERIRK